MPETKAALIVANWKYEDADLRQLVAPANDAEALAGILRNPNICGFQVTTLLNRTSRETCEQIERFFLDRKRDDLVLLYFSCHGIKDDDGLLYFAAPDTRLIEHSRPLRSTALSADFVRSVMRASNSRRQVLMLDCCYSGAFASAMLGKGNKSAGVKDQFEQGRGMVVMTASDALQYSFEGGSVAGEPVNSIFTRVMVKGIETGEADHDRDGTITLDELYDYVYERVVEENPNQRPKKWDLGVEGRIVLAKTPVVRPAELAPELVAAIGSPLSRVRVGAVGELVDLLNGRHKGLAASARQALEKLAGDDSRQVSAAAEAALGRPSRQSAPALSPIELAELSPGELRALSRSSAPSEQPTGPVPAPPAARTPFEPAPSAPAAPRSSGSSNVPHVPRAAAAPPARAPDRAIPLPPKPKPEPRVRIAPISAEDPRREEPPASPVGAGKSLLKPPSIFRRILPYGLLACVLAGLFIAFWHRPEPAPQRSSQQVQTQAPAKSSAAPAVVTTLALPAPPFDYYAAVPRADDTNVRLMQLSSTPNQITDDEEWFGNNDLSLATYTVPNVFKQEAGNLPPQVPAKLGDDIIIKAIKQDNNVLCIYGRNYGSGRYLTQVNLDTGKVNFAFDFHEFMHPPKYLNADREFVEETLHWAQVKDNVLYVSTGHNTYARSSYGQNAYLNAIETSTGRLLWRSKPLISNSANFLLYENAIITGYGFTDEQHFLYVVNQKDGRVVQTIPVRKSPSYILNKGDAIHVRTYDANLLFKATGQ
jgi:Caspase domain